MTYNKAWTHNNVLRWDLGRNRMVRCSFTTDPMDFPLFEKDVVCRHLWSDALGLWETADATTQMKEIKSVLRHSCTLIELIGEDTRNRMVFLDEAESLWYRRESDGALVKQIGLIRNYDVAVVYKKMGNS